MIKFRQTHFERYFGLFPIIFFKTLSVLFVLIFLLLFSPNISAQLLRPKKTEKDTQNSKENKTNIKIPWEQLDARTTQLIRGVMDNKTIYRKMPEQIGYCDAELYDLMVQHPDVVVGIWELLGITQISLTETSPNHFLLREGTSTTSHIEILYKSKNLCIVYAKGEYETPMLPRAIRGESVLFLTSRFGKDKKGRPVVQSNLDAYVQIQNSGADMLARVLVPVVGKVADGNFEQAVGFVMNISESAENDYEAVQSVALKLSHVRHEVAEELALLAEAIYDRETNRYNVADAHSLPPPKTLDKLVEHSSTLATEMPLGHSLSELPTESVFAEPLPKYAVRSESVIEDIDPKEAKYQEEQLIRSMLDSAPLSVEPMLLKNSTLRTEPELPQINEQNNNEQNTYDRPNKESITQEYHSEAAVAPQLNRVIISSVSPTRSKIMQSQTPTTILSQPQMIPQSSPAPQTTIPPRSINTQQRTPRFNTTLRFNPTLDNAPQNLEQISDLSDTTPTRKTTAPTITSMPTAIPSSSNPSSSSLTPPIISASTPSKVTSSAAVTAPTSATLVPPLPTLSPLRTYSTKTPENILPVPNFSAP
ncbi:MAG: hypothetical protein LBJ67_09690 [Planctomycetaceae bacterium]|jgi:hypothetical protein|nr:hypothetical protein [Planctomycetaceae bacterium]